MDERLQCPKCGCGRVVTYRVFTPGGVPLAVWHRCDECGKRWQEEEASDGEA